MYTEYSEHYLGIWRKKETRQGRPHSLCIFSTVTLDMKASTISSTPSRALANVVQAFLSEKGLVPGWRLISTHPSIASWVGQGNLHSIPGHSSVCPCHKLARLPKEAIETQAYHLIDNCHRLQQIDRSHLPRGFRICLPAYVTVSNYPTGRLIRWATICLTMEFSHIREVAGYRQHGSNLLGQQIQHHLVRWPHHWSRLSHCGVCGLAGPSTTLRRSSG